jgi:hypothetical protein
MSRNPRPCVCGHRGMHGPGDVLWVDGTPCTRYRPAPRVVPLRVLRNPVVIRPLWEKAR